MNIFDEESRKIMTRGVILSNDQMENFRIKKIYNSIGDPEFLSMDDAEEMLMNFIKRGEFCLMELASNDNNLAIISLITFFDLWSRNVFALMNFEYYEGFPDLITLYN
jgi:hypothetical protein